LETATHLNTTLKTLEKSGLDAWRFAQEIHILAAGLLPMMQPIYRSWLSAQSHGVLKDCSQEDIFVWLNGLHPGRAEAEYRLMLLEISWLETLTQDFYYFLCENLP